MQVSWTIIKRALRTEFAKHFSHRCCRRNVYFCDGHVIEPYVDAAYLTSPLVTMLCHCQSTRKRARAPTQFFLACVDPTVMAVTSEPYIIL